MKGEEQVVNNKWYMTNLIEFPLPSHYWLKNATVPRCLLPELCIGEIGDRSSQNPSAEAELVLVNIEILHDKIGAIVPTHVPTNAAESNTPEFDLRGGMILPCFVDMHTHLDKGHIWNRAPNPDGTFDSALRAVQQDAAQHWDAADVYRRMEFGLKCSYAHGTRALRTHIDSAGTQASISLEVFCSLREAWADRLHLQAVSLVPLDYFLTPAGEQLADQMAEVGGVLGGVVWMNPQITQQLDRTFQLAAERGLDLDFHTDESGNPDDMALRYVAEVALRHQFQGHVTCGHCCSLAVQATDVAAHTIARVKDANLGIVSLPMCNLYLQDRKPGLTPRWRGVTLLHELKAAGVDVALASDNCRDPFYGFGDHDMLEVLTQSTRIAHLDRPYGDWVRSVNQIPAKLMGLPTSDALTTGSSADLILFKARTFSELLSRPQSDRVVLRQGQAIDTTLPDYAELDEPINSLR